MEKQRVSDNTRSPDFLEPSSKANRLKWDQLVQIWVAEVETTIRSLDELLHMVPAYPILVILVVLEPRDEFIVRPGDCVERNFVWLVKVT